MLGKLLKYELKASGRVFLPLYGSVLVLALINRIFSFFDLWQNKTGLFPFEITYILTMSGYIFLICAIFVMTLFVTIQRFHKNLLGDEGYLMFTLPVKPWQHILSKLFATIIWFTISILVTIISVMIFGMDMSMFQDIASFFSELAQVIREPYGVQFLMFGLETIIILFLSLVSGILMIYASMSLGHLLTRHRIIGAFGAFLGINFITQMITSLVFNVTSKIVDNLFHLSGLSWDMLPTLHIIFLSVILWLGICCTAYFFTSQYVLAKKLNLE